MPLEAGQKLGPYEVLAPIGKGGMGEVYRARDTKLDRDVAVKVLPDEFAQDEERLARFEREAKLLASLNHPNIASIHGFEDSEGVKALVLELVEGPTLAERIERGPIAVDEAIAIANQIAEALEAGHESGVIHRDLKPANIKLKEDGTVKVLDYGLAKALEGEMPSGSDSEPSQSPTLTRQGTQVGVILGTAAYMSPEQARGKPVDKRTDIWAYGVVLYEMVAGLRAFKAEDVSLTLAAVMTADPDLTALPPSTPPALEAVIRGCLVKDPKGRIRDIGDARLALQGAFEMATPAVADTQGTWSRALPIVAALLFGGLSASLLGWSQWPSDAPIGITKFSYDPGSHFNRTGRTFLALSPDGRSIAYNTRAGLFLRTMDELQPRLIESGRTTRPLAAPFFSPDGLSLGYVQDGQLKRVAVSGGAPRVLAPAPGAFAASWAGDDTILFGERRGIVRVSADGGNPAVLIPAQPGEQFDGAQLLPDGQSVLFTVTAASVDQAAIVVESLTTGSRTVLVRGGRSPRYLASGHLVYLLGDVLHAVAFDPGSVTISGTAVPLVQMRGGTATTNYAVSDNGTLVYVDGSEDAKRRLLWIAKDGTEERVNTRIGGYFDVDLSPDGRWAAVEMVESGESRVWVTELARGTLTPLTTEAGLERRPLWSPDGRRVVYTARREGLMELRSASADGTGGSERLVSFDDTVLEVRAGSWSPDGSKLAIDVVHGDTGVDVGIVSIDGAAEWQPLIQSAANESKPAISPDGRWIAYQLYEGTQGQVYVQRFPDLGDRRQVSVGSNNHFNATWSRDGRALYYIRVRPRAVMRATISEDGAGAPVVGAAEVVLAHDFFSSPGTYTTWDVSPGGDRFLMIVSSLDMSTTSASEPLPQIIVVQNWFEELKRLVPTTN